jgi:hypothetical protein
MVDKEKTDKTGSIFLIIFTLLSFVGLLYLGIWSAQQQNIYGVAVAFVFTTMVIGSIAITKGEIFRLGSSWKKECVSFTVFFFIFFLWSKIGSLIGTKSYNMFSMGQSSLFATISSKLPLFWEVFMNNIVIPFSEESVWLVGLPIMLFWIMDLAGRNEKLSFFANKYAQMVITIILCSVSFALFHVGNVMLIGFIISAIIFRTVLITIYWGDKRFNLFNHLTIFLSGGIGAHSGANFGATGIIFSVDALLSATIGYFIVGLYLFIFATAVYALIKSLSGRGVKT